MSKQRDKETIASWFADPQHAVGNFGEFAGVLVFERIKKVKHTNRSAMVADTYRKAEYERKGPSMTMPFTSQPSSAWAFAPCVGFADNLEDAFRLMWPEDYK